MKKVIMMLVLMCTLGLKLRAQDKECVKQGNILVDGYYGFINPYNYILNLQIATDHIFGNTLTDFSTSNVGPIGIKGEYLVSNLIGFGVDMNYTNTIIRFDEYDGYNKIQTHTWNALTTRAFLGINFHYIRQEKVEMYSSIELGYFNRIITRSPVNPYRSNPQYNITPIGVRIETGFRFFIVPNFGIHLNVGTGINSGPVFGVGLSGKF